MDQEFGSSKCKLLYTEWIHNKILLYSTGKYIQYPFISHKGKKKCIYVYTHTQIYVCVKSVNCSVISDSLQLHELQPTRLLCPWNSPGKNTGMGSYFLLQGIFSTQGLQEDSLPSEPPGKSIILVVVETNVNSRLVGWFFFFSFFELQLLRLILLVEHRCVRIHKDFDKRSAEDMWYKRIFKKN